MTEIGPFRAILTRSQARPGWILSFKHPFGTAPDGRPIPKVRRGLTTTDEGEAKKLCEQMNRLLEDPTLWVPEAKSVATQQGFDPKVIRIFYETFPSPIRDPWDVREAVLPLPSQRERLRHGISIVQMVGITGSCKTSLGRQLIGTQSERFPSISNCRTTTCDIEIIAEPGQYLGVVTFLPRASVRQRLEECARTAIFRFIGTNKADEMARKFLEHEDQRFRLKYVLGDFPYDENSDQLSEHATPQRRELIERRKSSAVLLGQFLERLRALAEDAKTRAEQKLGVQYSHLDPDGKLRFEEEVDEYLETEAVEQFVEDVLDAVEQRFSFAERTGDLIRGDDDGWPSHWTLRHPERSVFLDAINYFSGNHWEGYGTLLTPLVDGIRVSGPFKADWMPEVVRWVILDGEGLGHTPDSASAVPLRITKRYDLADAILLTDRSDSSMQAASVAVLKSLVSSGHDSKLVVCFTKFDTTRNDDSRPRLGDRQNQLRNALDSAITDIAAQSDPACRYRLTSITDRVFFLEDLHKGKEISALAQSELSRLMEIVRAMAKPAEPIVVQPVYDLNFLPFRVQSAANEFHSRWRTKLALENWSRIKALSKSSMMLDPTGYANLIPVDDFAQILERHCSAFLEHPVAWNVADFTAEEAAEAIAAIKRRVHSLMGGLAVRRLIQDQAERWRSAYQRRGPGSTKPRARDIESLYNVALPTPEEVPGPGSSTFLKLIRDLVNNAILAANGRVLESDAVVSEVAAQGR